MERQLQSPLDAQREAGCTGEPLGRPIQALKGRTTPHMIKVAFCLITTQQYIMGEPS